MKTFCHDFPVGSRRREENPSAAAAQQGAKVPERCADSVRAAVRVAQASSPASSGGVSPPVPTRGETPRELAGGTPAVHRRCAIGRWQADRALGVALRLLTSTATTFCHLRNPFVPACRHGGSRVVSPWRRAFQLGAVGFCSLGLAVGALAAAGAPVAPGAPGAVAAATLELLPAAQVDGAGIFLHHLVVANPAATTPVIVPQIRIAAAPALAQTVIYSRAQVSEWLTRHAPELAASAWTGAPQVRITRRLRALDETELKQHLTDALQRDYVKDRGELDLRLVRPWTPVNIPDDPFTLRILDLPTSGVSANFIVRFELRTTQESVASWQLFLQAKIMKDVLIARSQLKRGTKLRDADLVPERRDVLTLREPLGAISTEDDTLELAEFVAAGQPLGVRSVRVRPVVLRGSVAEALVQDGALSVSIKVEVLEDGIPGQTIRIRNLQTKREFHGKVRNEQTILVTL